MEAKWYFNSMDCYHVDICRIHIAITLDLSDERKTWAEPKSEVQEVQCVVWTFTGTQLYQNRIFNNWL